MQKKLERNEMTRRLIDATLQLIEENGGLNNVNLRQIARRANCAHTNIYNYYQNFEGLLWDVIARIGELWLEICTVNFRPGMPIEELVCQFAEIQFDFAIAHPGWYRCLWSEPLSGKPPMEIIEERRKQRYSISLYITQASLGMIDKDQADRLFVILFSYLHGAISMLIDGRIYKAFPQEHKDLILTNTRFLLQAFKEHHE
jgi:AcrR family transcriptional regulator